MPLFSDCFDEGEELTSVMISWGCVQHGAFSRGLLGFVPAVSACCGGTIFSLYNDHYLSSKTGMVNYYERLTDNQHKKGETKMCMISFCLQTHKKALNEK